MLNWKLAGTALGVIAVIAAPTASASAASRAHTSAGSDVASSTKANALTAMHGEAFAYAKYGAYAGQAARTGKTTVADLFTRTAGVELGDHYASEAKVAGLVGSDQANLQDAITGETYETTTMYPGFAAQAKTDGCTAAADLFTEIAKDEAGHAAAYTTALGSLSRVPERHKCHGSGSTGGGPGDHHPQYSRLLGANPHQPPVRDARRGVRPRKVQPVCRSRCANRSPFDRQALPGNRTGRVAGALRWRSRSGRSGRQQPGQSDGRDHRGDLRGEDHVPGLRPPSCQGW